MSLRVIITHLYHTLIMQHMYPIEPFISQRLHISTDSIHT